jgi:hypothetical protein
MARSVKYWYDYMIAEKTTMASLNALQPVIDDAQTLLTDVTTTSRVARWRLWLWIVATCAYSLDVVFDLAIITLEALAKRSRFGTLPWYIQQAYEFQYGDTLVYVNNEYKYATFNPAVQIIKRAASQENGNTVNIKLAKLVAGIPTKLTVPEKAAATTYFQLIKPAGVTLNIISDDPDEIILNIKVNFDALLLDATGQLLSTPGTYPVINAINNFLNNVIFDGTLELCNLIDEIQKTTGVKSAYMLSASGRYGANPFVVFPERYYPNAGHMKIHPTNPLSSTITYTPIN